MKKILNAIVRFLAVALLCTDYLYKKDVEFPESLYTIFIMVFFAVVIKFMVEINIAYYKRKKGVIFRPPFFKEAYLEDYEKYGWNRIAVYALFGAIVGLLFYLTRSEITWSIPQVIEILAVTFGFYILAWDMFENQVKRCIKIKSGDLSKEIEYTMW
ncbi:MAG: hypothetical protein R3Y18_00625 [Bacillota bacterium]